MRYFLPVNIIPVIVLLIFPAISFIMGSLYFFENTRQYHMIGRLNRYVSLTVSQVFLISLDQKPNLYTLLQIEPDAKPEKIRYNYYKLLKQYHPDVASDPLAHTKLLNEAYAILSNEKLRKEYDQLNGYDKMKQNAYTESKIRAQSSGKNDQTNRKYNQAKRGFTAYYGDRHTRAQYKILTLLAIGVFISTLLLIFHNKEGSKPFQSGGLFKPKYSKQQFERDFQTTLKS